MTERNWGLPGMPRRRTGAQSPATAAGMDPGVPATGPGATGSMGPGGPLEGTGRPADPMMGTGTSTGRDTGHGDAAYRDTGYGDTGYGDTAYAGGYRGDRMERHDDPRAVWEARTRIALTPVAAPSILGLFGFFGATLMVGTLLAGWWGSTTTSPLFIFPFAMMFGGVAQFLAGMWSYKARDGLATAMHGTWGSFWFAYGILYLLQATKVVTLPTGNLFPELGFWFIPLCVITLAGALASLAKSLGLFAVLSCLAAGSGLAATGYMGGYSWALHTAGWLFVFSAGFAWYTASAMMLEESYGRVILPIGKWSRRGNLPGAEAVYPMEYSHGMPGVRVGQ